METKAAFELVRYDMERHLAVSSQSPCAEALAIVLAMAEKWAALVKRLDESGPAIVCTETNNTVRAKGATI